MKQNMIKIQKKCYCGMCGGLLEFKNCGELTEVAAPGMLTEIYKLRNKLKWHSRRSKPKLDGFYLTFDANRDKSKPSVVFYSKSQGWSVPIAKFTHWQTIACPITKTAKNK